MLNLDPKSLLARKQSLLQVLQAFQRQNLLQVQMPDQMHSLASMGYQSRILIQEKRPDQTPRGSDQERRVGQRGLLASRKSNSVIERHRRKDLPVSSFEILQMDQRMHWKRDWGSQTMLRLLRRQVSPCLVQCPAYWDGHLHHLRYT